ncbi:hypothetical protein DSO57_1034466, partial [Entomophthora muscae]
PCPLKDSLSPANESTNPGNIPAITWATANGELQKLPQEQRLPVDDKSCDLKKEIGISRPSLANKELSLWSATKRFIIPSLISLVLSLLFTKPKKTQTNRPSYAVHQEHPTVNSLPPLALDQTIFPPHTKKGLKVTAKLLNSLRDLAHTVDERFVLAYPVDFLALAAPPWEETLINLDYLLAWFCPLLKTIKNAQSGEATSMSRESNKSEMLGLLPSQSGGGAEIELESSSTPGHAQQNFSPSQPDEPLEVM